jgi:16S rRNA (cytidine1402-2'-O)-methyltransferase
MSTLKRQDLPSRRDPNEPSQVPGVLWVVATPIGNLEDMSPRAKQTLERAHTLLCEDTRQGAKLVSALRIAKAMSRLERLDAHSGEKALKNWVARMQAGESFALITDAGTPAISDPGSALVRRAAEEGIEIIPIPGPSAVPTLLSVAGFEETSFTFRGFFPRNASEQKNELELALDSGLSRVYIWFESPRRVSEALSRVAETCPEAPVAAAKELTKIHEKIFRGTALEIAREVQSEIDREGERGEWIFAVRFPALEKGAAGGTSSKNSVSEESMKALHCLIDAGVSASVAARQVSHHFGAHKKSVYDAALRIAGKISEKK